MTMNRRTLIKTTLAAVVSTALLPGVSQARQLEEFEHKFDRLRSPGKRPATDGRQIVDVRDFGAVGDGAKLDTRAIQKAIDAAAQLAGGGTVLLGRGQFLTGALHLRDKVHLQVDAGATLLGSTDIYQYQDDRGQVHSLINAGHCRDVAISGTGTIDGQGRILALNINRLHHSGQRIELDFNDRRNRSRHRPSVLAFDSCTGVRIYDVTIRNGASWVQHYASCQDVAIDNIKVLSDAFWNNDGIDINDCRDVTVTGCFVNSADDAICLKSNTSGQIYNKNIHIDNCYLRSSSNAVKLGTESMWGFVDISITNLVVFDTYRSAIAIETVDGARLQNVLVSDVRADNVGCALFLRRGQRNRDVPADTAPGVLKNVKIRNVKASIALGRADADYDLRGPALNDFFNPIPASITGLPDAPVENIVLENIDITYPGRANKGLAYRPYDQLFLIPEARDAYPEYTMFGELPSWGFYVRHASGLSLKNITLRLKEPDFRPALVFDDVEKLKVSRVNIYTKNDKQLILSSVRDEKITGLYSLNDAGRLAEQGGPTRVGRAGGHSSFTR